MQHTSHSDVIIIGGSYAGLSAAMALGRSLRNVLVIDSNTPCNRMTPHAHNLITHDGKTPKEIRDSARKQVENYSTILFKDGLVTSAKKTDSGFAVTTQNGENISAKKLLFATGVTDIMPGIEGFADCWGKSVLHCPYCHGYEVHSQKLGVMANGEMGFEFTKLLNNWSKDLTLFTNGKSMLTTEQLQKLQARNIVVIEKEIKAIHHDLGHIRQLVFTDGSTEKLDALFAKIPFTQQCKIPEQLGCALTEQGFILIDELQKTNITGVYAAGDTTTMFRTLSAAIGAGTKAGAMINLELVNDEF